MVRRRAKRCGGKGSCTFRRSDMVRGSEASRVFVAVGSRSLSKVVLLVIVFRLPERAGGREAGRHVVPFGHELVDKMFRRPALFLAVVEDFRTILFAPVGALPVHLLW